jgi:ABC-type anion transport system duplicated permease subunit
MVNIQPSIHFKKIMFDDISLGIWIFLMFTVFVHPTNALILFIVYACIGPYKPCFYFPLLLACPKSLIVTCNQEKKNVEIWGVIFHDLHDVMYMSMSHVKSSMHSKNVGKIMCGNTLINIFLVTHPWTNHF